MVVSSHAVFPTLKVLENGGRMDIKELSIKLAQMDPTRFRGDVTSIIEHNINCLNFQGNLVVYNKDAKSYTKHYSLIERCAQGFLHKSIPEMDKWALYPYMTRKNSPTCNLGINWEDIPDKNNLSGPEWFGDQTNCNFRELGKKYCGFSCGIDQNKAIGNIYSLFDDFAVIGELHQAINKRG